MWLIICPARRLWQIICLVRRLVINCFPVRGHVTIGIMWLYVVKLRVESSLCWAIPPTAGLVTNDTIVGDPLFTVPITATGTSLCFEVHGSANRIFNLVSDVCTTVNAHYAPMDIPENGNIISHIGVRAVPHSGLCKNIRVELDGCRAFIDDTEVIGSREEEGVEVRRMRNRVRISVPNCANLRLVMWAMCQNISRQTMLRFVITRGLNLRPTSHGLLGMLFLSLVPYMECFQWRMNSYFLLLWQQCKLPQYILVLRLLEIL